MNEDDPSDTVHEAFAAQLFGDTPLGRPILGTVDSINSITRAQIAEHYASRYKPVNLVVAAAGSLDHAEVVELTRSAFGPALKGNAEPLAPRLAAPAARPGPAAAGVGVRLVSRGIEQANLVLGCGALSRTDDRRFALGVLNAALGGGMSSRLFQEVREKRGLAYSVYSFSSQHADTGLWGVYAGCLPSKADEVLSIGLEDPSSRMSRLGKSELVYPRLEPVEEILASIEAVTHDDVREVAAAVLARPKALAVVGPFDDADAFTAALG